METMNLLILLIKTGGVATFLWFFIVLIKLAIKYWPKHDIKMERITGSSIKYSKNYGLFEAIFHVIKWAFRWTKIDPLEIMEALEKADETKSSTMEKDNIKKLLQEKPDKVEEIDTQ